MEIKQQSISGAHVSPSPPSFLSHRRPKAGESNPRRAEKEWKDSLNKAVKTTSLVVRSLR